MSSEAKVVPDDLLDAMAAGDALETFLRLPRSTQEDFRGWIYKARDDESRWRRINALVLAMRIGALEPDRSSGSEDVIERVLE